MGHRMRRHLITMTALVLSFLFVAEGPAQIQTDREKAGFKGPVLTVVENSAGSDQTVVTAYNSKGGEKERIIYSSINYGRHAHTYDAQARRTKTDHYWSPEDGAPRQTTRYTYDAKGKLIQEITCDTTGCFNKKVYRYDSREKLTEEVLYYPSGDSFKVRLVHAYDPQGHRIQTTIQEAHGPGLGIGDTVQEYDPDGKLTKCTTHYTGHKAGDEEGKLDFPPYDLITTNKYNSHGDITEQTTYNTKNGPEDKDECGCPPCHTTYEYQYDSHGNWTKRKEFSCTPADLYHARCRKLEGEVERTITYYETGTR